jgi:hypothetical protein
MNLNRCQFANSPCCLRRIDDGDDDENGAQRMIMNHKIYQDKRLVNGAMDAITEIIWPLFRSAKLYDQDIPAVKVDFEETGELENMPVQYTAKFSCETANGEVTVNFMLGIHST